MKLKNIITGQIGTFAVHQGDDWIGLTQQELDNLNLNTKKEELIKSRRSYLASTDWYVARELDQPNSYPEEIKLARIKARQEINEIQNISSINDLLTFK